MKKGPQVCPNKGDSIVRILPVPSSTRQPAKLQYLSSYVINDTVVIDAGSVAFGLPREQQLKIKHILVSHTHLDHLASLPMFLDTVYDGTGDCATIHGTAATLASLRQDLFNNRLWPDFIAISEQVPPYLKLREMTPRQPLEVADLRITPIPVDHVIECMGFVVEDGKSAVVFSSDTGPTEELWQAARALSNLKAVFLEVTFPNDMAWLADRAKHLTPALAQEERRKIPEQARVLAVHLHSRHRPQVEKEISQLETRLEIARFGKEYHF
jgi:ribonuclease BN (tRNA processing enzyme)